jgi:hypothetical protein
MRARFHSAGSFRTHSARAGGSSIRIQPWLKSRRSRANSPFVQFQKSQHYALLRAGTANGPSCSTCHGTASGVLLNPKDFERECNARRRVLALIDRLAGAASSR